jgi:hypothetical protein
VQIKSKKWLDGKNWDMWPSLAEHIGWTVVTAGPVDLELEGHTPMWNMGPLKQLPYEFPMILKDIDGNGNAYCYHHENGVMRMPATVLKPWQK